MTGIKNDRSYIRTLLKIAIPMMIQNGISNFVNLLDNLMIGRVGTNALSGVAIANQLIFVFYLVIFGATAGVGIFTAQYKGSGDDDGIRNTFQFKIGFNTLIAAVCVAILAIFSRSLINLFLLGEGDPADAAETLEIGVKYMNIILISLIPIGLTQAYAGTLRDLGSTKVPMFSSLVAIFVNLIGNYLLIYGHLGLPALGASGAAIATVISRFVELSILIVYTGRHSDMFPFIKGAFKGIKIPGELALKFLLKALPLMANETLWSLGMTTINQCYSYRSLDAVAALNIQSTIWNLMAVAFIAMGEAVGIMMGHILGAGELDDAKQKGNRILRPYLRHPDGMHRTVLPVALQHLGLYPQSGNRIHPDHRGSDAFLLIHARLVFHHQIRRKCIHYRAFRQRLHLGHCSPARILPEQVYKHERYLDALHSQRHGSHQVLYRLCLRQVWHLGKEYRKVSVTDFYAFPKSLSVLPGFCRGF